jgi:hypothetical protein
MSQTKLLSLLLSLVLIVHPVLPQSESFIEKMQNIYIKISNKVSAARPDERWVDVYQFTTANTCSISSSQIR